MPQLEKHIPESAEYISDEDDGPAIIDVDIIATEPDSHLETNDRRRSASLESVSSTVDPSRQKLIRLYFVIPLVFLTVTLLGGLRLASAGNDFVFLKPALICLVLAVILLFLYVRGGLIALDGYINEEFSILRNIANATVLLALFAASAQLFNSVMPEQGLPFWVVAFCFLWTLWNNLFADFDNKKLLRSVAALFTFAFAAKYLVLANLTAPASENWLRAMIENPAQEAFTWILALPKYSAGTGYIQFFTILLYFMGLFLLPQTTQLRNLRNDI